MPATFTRRQILKSTAAALASAALPSCTSSPSQTPSQSPRPQTLTIALLSDTHLGKDGTTAAADQMKQATDEINAANPAFTLMCGDLVHGGQDPAAEKHYPHWLSLAASFRNPWHAIPGNHDPDALFLKHIQPQTDFTLTHGHFAFICFRDAIGNPNHQGIVTPGQLSWIQSQIDAATQSNRRCILVSHIIYHDNKKPDPGWMIKQGRAEFADLLKSNSHSISAFFAGHFHEGLRLWSDTHGIYEIVLPSACWNTNHPGLATAPGYSAGEFRPGFCLADLSPTSLSLRYKPLGHPALPPLQLPLT